MDPSEAEALAQRLVVNPHDEEALNYAHQQGSLDPQGYALFLERLGAETPDPSYAAHWLAEAANVWTVTIGDAHRAAHLLMLAIDKDPAAQLPAERLAQLYRDKGDTRGLVALLSRRAKALAPLVASDNAIRNELAGMHEELGRLYTESVPNPKKALESFRKAVELDPQSAYAIYNARELLKSMGLWEEAFHYYAMELALEPDQGRKVALLRDEAATRRVAGDLAGTTRALGLALQLAPDDPNLHQEYAASVLDRAQARQEVTPDERAHAAVLLVSLAETYRGEHGLAYAGGALELDPGHEAAMRLFAQFAHELGRQDEARERLIAFEQLRPASAASVRELLGFAPDSAEAPPSAAGDTQVTHVGASESASPMSGYGGTATIVRPQAVAEEPPPVESDRRGPMSPEKLQGLLDAAQMLIGKGKKPEAYGKYKEVLDADPAHPEALSWVEDYLRSKRDYAALRDVLVSSVRAVESMQQSVDTRRERLREIAGLSEVQLRDIDGAIAAWKQLLAVDRSDEAARSALTRLLEKMQRWDDLANLYEQEATSESNVEAKISLEKKLAQLHEHRRKDLLAAGEAWARIAQLVPDDEQATLTAAKLFERAERADLAAHILAESAPRIEDPIGRGTMLERLGELREQLGDNVASAEAYAEAAEALKMPKLWDAAERLFSAAEQWDRAAHASTQRAALAGDPKQQASFLGHAADLYMRAGDQASALERLEQASDLDPLSDDYANALIDAYSSSSHIPKLVDFLSRRGDRLIDRIKRIGTRRQAAALCSAHLEDRERARELWLKVLEDGDDREALERLIEDATLRQDHTEATTLLRRLGAHSTDRAEKARIALREADLLANGVGDIETAISRYEYILGELDATCRPALQAIADLQESRENLPAAADALERELKLVADIGERGDIARRLASIYEQQDDIRAAIRAHEMVKKADPEDFDALMRLCELTERAEDWPKLAELLVERIEVEGDETESATLTRKLAMILADRLGRGDEALAALTELADQGDPAVREAYVDLGDRLGWKGIVASKLVEWWFEGKHGPERTTALKNAFDRFVEVGRDTDAVRVGMELVRVKGADTALAQKLEDLAIKTNDEDAMSTAHDLMMRETSGFERAQELVRQAEVRVRAGLPRLEAMQHGEAGLASMAATDVEPLLERLAQLAPKPADVIDLYERQVTRAKSPLDRVRALARAAQVAGQKGQLDRARGFFELALSGTPNAEVLELVEGYARDGDKLSGHTSGEKLRRALCSALAAGGQGARDGGRTRSGLLRRAANIAHGELHDTEQAFVWLGEALIAHVDGEALDAIEDLANQTDSARRCEDALSLALSEVFDGPLVRQLLGRRAKIRRHRLRDLAGAASDLKKLHDLSPNDQAVLDELAELLIELQDYRTLVQVYEDQILRGKDLSARAELARKVARMWEEQLADARETADAWRRVLRMKAGDEEATQGLERAKANALKRPDPASPRDSYAPPRLPQQPAPAPAPVAKSPSSPPARPPSAPSPPRVPQDPLSAPRLSDVPSAPRDFAPPPSSRPITAPPVPPASFVSAPPPPSSRSGASVPAPPSSRSGASASAPPSSRSGAAIPAPPSSRPVSLSAPSSSARRMPPAIASPASQPPAEAAAAAAAIFKGRPSEVDLEIERSLSLLPVGEAAAHAHTAPADVPSPPLPDLSDDEPADLTSVDVAPSRAQDATAHAQGGSVEVVAVASVQTDVTGAAVVTSGSMTDEIEVIEDDDLIVVDDLEDVDEVEEINH